LSIISDPALLAVLAGAGTAAAIDIRTRRIPNVLSIGTAIAGLALAALGATGISVASSMTGLVLGLVLMLPGHVFGATGAGDVKLMGGVGAVLGAGRIVPAFFLTAIAGGVIALALALGGGRLGSTLRRTGKLLHAPTDARREIDGSKGRNAFAYGPAIFVGSALAALL
jgi:prepilin peptidase CpaA